MVNLVVIRVLLLLGLTIPIAADHVTMVLAGATGDLVFAGLTVIS